MSTPGWSSCLLNQLLLISPSDVDWILGLHAWIPERLNYQHSSHLEACDSKVIREISISNHSYHFKNYIYAHTNFHRIKRSSSVSYFWEVLELLRTIPKLFFSPSLRYGDFASRLHAQSTQCVCRRSELGHMWQPKHFLFNWPVLPWIRKVPMKWLLSN